MVQIYPVVTQPTGSTAAPHMTITGLYPEVSHTCSQPYILFLQGPLQQGTSTKLWNFQMM